MKLAEKYIKDETGRFVKRKRRKKFLPKVKVSKDFCYIYGLFSPLLNKYFYIGVSTNPKVRYYQHLRADSNNLLKNDHINLLKTKGLEPKLILLAQPPIDLAYKWENYYIDYIRSLNNPLTNKSSKFSTGGLFVLSENDIEILATLAEEEQNYCNRELEYLQSL